jgi:Family of unknown function (DUF6338)
VLPESTSSAILLAVLVVPGLIFELLRERRRPAINKTGFRELTWIVLTSVVFGGMSLAALAIVGKLFSPSWLVDLGEWSDNTSYVRDHTSAVVVSVSVQTILAASLAWIADSSATPIGRRVSARGSQAKSRLGKKLGSASSDRTQRVTPHSVWWTAFMGPSKPIGSTVLVDARLRSGKTLSGVLAAHTTGDGEVQHDLLFRHSGVTPVILWDGDMAQTLTDGTQRHLVMVSAGEIEFVIVGFRDGLVP